MMYSNALWQRRPSSAHFYRETEPTNVRVAPARLVRLAAKSLNSFNFKLRATPVEQAGSMSTAVPPEAAGAPSRQVIVVGAGVSGLVAALSCVDAGMDPKQITVFEGRARIGGRVYAHNGHDLGGAWCWPSAGHTEFAHLAARFGAKPFPQPSNGVHLIDCGPNMPPQTTRQPFDSAKLRFSGGAARVASAISEHLRAQGVDIRLGTRLTSIKGSSSGGLLACMCKAGDTDSTLHAQWVLLAIPPRLMLPPFVSWDPPLCDVAKRALQRKATWMAGTSKILVMYGSPFWRAKGFSGDAMAGGAAAHSAAIQQLYDASMPDDSSGSYALCGFNFGGRSASLPPDELGAAAVSQLERLFGGDAASPTAVHVMKWGDEELTCGDGTHAEGGGGHGGNDTDWQQLQLLPNVLLCSAETDQLHSGLLEGAVRAGRAAAQTVLDSLSSLQC